MIAPAQILGLNVERPQLSRFSSADIFNNMILPQANSLTSQIEGAARANEAALTENPVETQGLPAPRAIVVEDPLQPSASFLDQVAQGSGQTPEPTISPVQPQVPSSQPLGARSPGDPSAQDLNSFVRGFEGFNANAYDDYGQTSIGYGTRAQKGETSISQEDAQRRLDEELGTHRARVEQLNAGRGYNFSPNQLDALTSFDYNTGRLEQLTANGSRDPETIAAKILEYNKAGGKALPGLIRRRQAEARLFSQGY